MKPSANTATKIFKPGKVFLVGAGPGDPGLLTLKAKQCIEEAHVVIYDYLANRVFLEYASEKAEIIYVGKKGGDHTMKQEDINALIIEKTANGKTVVRLKGGDPFIFGRGGEEAQELIRAGVPFEVIPGVTSAISVPAYAGIPLTHRDYTATVAFVTGHEDPTKEKSNIHWDKLATAAGTLVFLMGVGNIAKIAERLVACGRSSRTPAAVIRRGTMSDQETVTGNLENIAERTKNAGIRPPAIIVVGDVVTLREELNWFETKPLFGKRIIVTRAREQASGFLKKLASLGAECIQFPTIQVIPPESWEALDTAIGHLVDYAWILFTSPNGVKFFLERLHFHGKDVRDLKGIRIGAIGPKTAEKWHRLGIVPDLVPEEYRAEAIVEAFRKMGDGSGKILLPRAAKAREVLPEDLKKMGFEVDVVPAYQTIKPDQDTAIVAEMLREGRIHMVTFTSSSTVTNFLSMMDQHDRTLRDCLTGVTIACIGPVTAKTAKENGLNVTLTPKEYTIDSLTDAILEYYGKKG